MTASGPFAMGPALAGSSGSRRPAPKTAIAIPTAPPSALGKSLSNTAPATIKQEESGKGKQKAKSEEVDEEVYSEPDEGVEIIDLEKIEEMDENAPESLKRERTKPKLKVEGKDASGAIVPLLEAF
jgi:DNA-directed RNA polymerase III subunit RPC4